MQNPARDEDELLQTGTIFKTVRFAVWRRNGIRCIEIEEGGMTKLPYGFDTSRFGNIGDRPVAEVFDEASSGMFD